MAAPKDWKPGPTTDDGRRIVFAFECFPCEECGEPVCPYCMMHYAECPCPGPNWEMEE